MADTARKTALVTGASAGIGRELARLFARDGHDLVLVARRRDRLEELASELARDRGVSARVLAEDLADPGAAERIASEFAARRVDVDFLVNNAGFGQNGAFAALDARRAMAMLQVNVTSLVSLTRALLPAMIDRRSGRVLNVGSTAGFEPGPFMAVYYASKAFVNSFTEALSFELRGSGVTATLCCPGPTATEFAEIAGNRESRLFQMAVMDAKTVAAAAYHAMLQGKPMVVPGLWNKLGVQALRVAPRATVRSMTAALNRSVGGGTRPPPSPPEL
ncbi:MAG: SDR family oxidoreductase, partial [Myxococcales bacterium]|nr:SDR family oxidoreductase [Myxococcales bacterium]